MHHPGCHVLCRNSLANGKGRNTASKTLVHWQGHAEDMDTMPARSNTATPGPSDDDMQSILFVSLTWVT